MTKTQADDASAAGRALVKRRHAKETPEERSRAASHAASAPWANLTAAERRKEMKRRLAGKKKAQKKAAKRGKARKKAA